MLKIYFGDMNKAIYNTEIYFKNDYDPEWLNDNVVVTDMTELLKTAGRYV